MIAHSWHGITIIAPLLFIADISLAQSTQSTFGTTLSLQATSVASGPVVPPAPPPVTSNPSNSNGSSSDLAQQYQFVSN